MDGSRCLGILYDRDGNWCFPFYWTENPVSVFGFHYDRLSPGEIQTLSFLKSFSMMKTQDIMEMSDDQDNLLAHQGNDHHDYSIA